MEGKVLFISVAPGPRYFRKCFALFKSLKKNVNISFYTVFHLRFWEYQFRDTAEFSPSSTVHWCSWFSPRQGIVTIFYKHSKLPYFVSSQPVMKEQTEVTVGSQVGEEKFQTADVLLLTSQG